MSNTFFTPLPNNFNPKQENYFFPAEWEKHEATWLSWPHKNESWPGKLQKIFPAYVAFIKELSKGEKVKINVNNTEAHLQALNTLQAAETNLSQIEWYLHPTNDAWCRDHGPAFLINPHAKAAPKIIINWNYNAWGNKYPPYDLDNLIPLHIARQLQLPSLSPGIVMEGGSVDFNGKGTVLTTRQCLLNPNRNPHLSQSEIENYLETFYGVSQILWLDKGIVGDDTDGHIDDITRFVSENKVVTVVEKNKADDNYFILQNNLKALKKMRLLNGKPLDIIELPMPSPVVYEGQRLPASYANFYIANTTVIVPTYQCAADQEALDLLKICFPDREVIGIDSTDIIWGLGSFHCLSQQEPAL